MGGGTLPRWAWRITLWVHGWRRRGVGYWHRRMGPGWSQRDALLVIGYRLGESRDD